MISTGRRRGSNYSETDLP